MSRMEVMGDVPGVGPNLDRHEVTADLALWNVEGGYGSFAHVVVPRVPYHTDNGSRHLFRETQAGMGKDGFAHGILTGIEPVGEALGDEDHRLGPHPVLRLEPSALKEGDSQGLEIARGHHSPARLRFLAGWGRWPVGSVRSWL